MIENLKKHKKLILKTAIIIVSVLIVLLATLIIYMNAHLYEINETPYTIEQYLSDIDGGMAYTVEGNVISFLMPKEVLTTQIIQNANNFILPKHYDIKALRVNEIGRLEVNATYYGFNWSFSCAINPTINDGVISLDISDMTLTDKDSRFLYKRQQKKLAYFLGKQFPVTYDTSELGLGDLVKMTDLVFVPNQLSIATTSINTVENDNQLDGLASGSYKVSLEVNQDLLIQELKTVGDTANEDIIQMYRNSETSEDTIATEYITNADNLTSEDITYFINDYLTSKDLLRNILLMSNIDILERVFKDYESFLSGISQTEIIETKGEVLSGNLMQYYSLLKDALDTIYFPDTEMYFSQGQPYDFKKGTITVRLINDEQTLGISDSILEKMKFCHENGTDLVKLSYMVDQNTYLVLSDETQALYQKDAYDSTYGVPDYGDAKYCDDIETWEAIESQVKAYFSVEQVYIRFMKSDDRYVFAIVSPITSYQNYWVFVYEKVGDEYIIVMDNITTMKEINDNLPDFNLDLATKDIEDVTLYNISEETKETILQDMSNKRIIESSNDNQIVYCSYGGDYLDLLLDNGIEYVYYIYGTHLHTVYQKEEAIANWPNLSELITLQDKPD